MVETVYELKNMLLEELMKDAKERGIERLDKDRVDMVKDLAEAEKSCWEAEYYRGVTEAMEGQGYSGYSGGASGTSGAQGAQGTGSQGYNRGNGSGYRDSRGRYARRGYGYSEHLNALKQELQSADPQEKERMMQELRNMM